MPIQKDDKIYKITNKKVTNDTLDAMWKEIDSSQLPNDLTTARFHGDCSISHLVLYRNEMSETVVEKLTEKLCQYKIACLYIWCNAISDIGTHLIAESLTRNLTCSLEVLDLSRNNITDKGACCIASHFKGTGLLSLDLSHNPISDTGFIALLDSLDLHHLTLVSCKITEKGAKHLVARATNSYRVSDVKLIDNLDISLEYFVIIELALERNRKVCRTAARNLINFSQVFPKLHLPFPNEIKRMIIDTQITPYLCERDAKCIRRVFFDPCFRGWIKSPHPFSMEEVLRTCRFLFKQRHEFVKIMRLREECKVVSQTLKETMKEMYAAHGAYRRQVIYENVCRSVFSLAGPIPFMFKVVARYVVDEVHIH